MRLFRDILVACILLGSFFIYLLSTPSRDIAAPVSFSVAPNSSFSDIGNLLYREHLIRSPFAFRVYGFFTGTAHLLRPGTYVLKEPISTPRLISLLVRGPEAVSFTIPPGMTLREIDDRLAALSILPSGALIAFDTPSSISLLRARFSWIPPITTLEGFLFPDTYLLFPSNSPEEVVSTLLRAFEKKALTFFKPDDSLLRVILLASLLEKEVPEYEDRRIVAGIIEKRLVARMPLQIDATVLYARCGGKFLGCAPLRVADYAFESPYNTYVVSKFPPAPISNPSTSAIRAALLPQRSAYWYYLSDPKTKRTVFSTTLDEHNNNRARYLLNK